MMSNICLTPQVGRPPLQAALVEGICGGVHSGLAVITGPWGCPWHVRALAGAVSDQETGNALPLSWDPV